MTGRPSGPLTGWSIAVLAAAGILAACGTQTRSAGGHHATTTTAPVSTTADPTTTTGAATTTTTLPAPPSSLAATLTQLTAEIATFDHQGSTGHHEVGNAKTLAAGLASYRAASSTADAALDLINQAVATLTNYDQGLGASIPIDLAADVGSLRGYASAISTSLGQLQAALASSTPSASTLAPPAAATGRALASALQVLSAFQSQA